MTEINKKTGLSPLIEFENEVNVLQKLVRNQPYPFYKTNSSRLIPIPIPNADTYISQIESKKYDFNSGFTAIEKKILKILVRRVILGFQWSDEYYFLCRFCVWRKSIFEEDGERAEKSLEYFDNLCYIAKKYGLLTTELIEIIKKINKFFKPVRANIKKWKSKC